MTIETHPRRIPHLRARNLRHDQTDAEAKLWARLRGGQLEGLKFRRQFPLGQFIADFCCPQRRLIIELDGGQHAEQRSADEWRSRILSERGYRVLRFWNDEVLTNMDGVFGTDPRGAQRGGIVRDVISSSKRMEVSDCVDTALTRARQARLPSPWTGRGI